MEYTAYRSPWQFGYVERVIGGIKRECLDHLIILNENHLRSILTIIFIIIISAELSWD
jgi:putative transposase